MKKWMLIPALAGVVVLGGVAMASAFDSQEVHAKDAVNNQGLLSIEEAEAKAIETVGGTVKEIELERKRSGYVYEVEVKSEGIEYDLKLDAKTGEILKNEKDDDDDWNGKDDKKQQDQVVIQDKDNQIKSDAKNKKTITTEEAIAIAMKQASGKVTELELDDDDGRLQYEIEIKDGKVEYEFEIDAYTGEVLKFEKDFDDDDDDDDDNYDD